MSREYKGVDVQEYYDALVLCYCWETAIQSTWPAMQKAPSYIVLTGEHINQQEVTRALLKALDEGRGGMSLMHLLAEIQGEWPSPEKHTVIENGFAKTNVNIAVDAWLKWGDEHGYVTK